MRTILLNISIVFLGAMAAWPQTSSPAPTTANPPATTTPAPHPSRSAGGRRAGGFLGVDIRDLSPERAGQLSLKDGRGAEVVMVDQDAPAAKAGLRENDVITSFDGRKVNNSGQLREMIRTAPPGHEITITVVRDGHPISLKATLGNRKDVYVAGGEPMHVEAPDIMVPAIPAMALDVPGFNMLQYSARNGAIVEDLTPQLAEYFGVHNGEGVLVRQVLHATPAEAAGLKAGDVIIKAGSQRIRSSADWRRALRTNQSALSVTVMRERRAQRLSMSVPEQGPDIMDFNMHDLNSEMQELQQHMQELGPEIEQATRESQIEMQRHLRELYKAQKAHAAAVEKARRDAQSIQGAQPANPQGLNTSTPPAQNSAPPVPQSQSPRSPQ